MNDSVISSEDRPKVKIRMNALSVLGCILFAVGTTFLIVTAAINLGSIAAGEDMEKVQCMIFGRIGLTLFLSGLAGLAITYARYCAEKRIVKDGYYLEVPVERIYCNTTVYKNGVYPWVMLCRHQDVRGRNHYFRSRNFWYYPAEYMGKNVKVYVGKNSYYPYYMDIRDNVIIH
ncbi:MAG: hypothetical protein LKF52_10240 [Butyrivibrio sp.]|nr:hypothetical protein [Butyrivibrio sp.]